MTDHTENTLRAVSKALTNVVAPAVDAKNPLANEQLRLVIDYVNFVRQRLDRIGERERFELTQNVKMASALVGLTDPASAVVRASLDTRLAEARAALVLAGAPLSRLRSASAGLSGAIRRLVREAAAFEPGARRPIERCVVDMSSTQIMFERSWYLPLGFEPAPGEVPPLADILSKA